MQQFEKLHKNVSRELIAIRKEFSPVQDRVYFLLDNIDKMSALTKEISLKKKKYKTNYLQILQENINFKKEQTQLQQTCEQAKTESQALLSQLTQERERSAFLEKQYQSLNLKLTQYEEEALAQSLSRTSTSDPISPR